MKKILFLLLSVALLASCSVKTNEEKALELIEPDLKANLIKPESYEFAKLQLDSCFRDDGGRNPDGILFSMKAANLYKEYKSYVEKVDNTKSASDFYSSSGFQSTLFKQQAAQNKAEMEKAQRKASFAKNKILQLFKDNKQLLIDVNSGKHEFIGWQALLTFRTETAGGTKILEGIMYFLNKDLSEITLRVTEDEFKDVSENSLEDITYEFEEELKEMFEAQ